MLITNKTRIDDYHKPTKKNPEEKDLWTKLHCDPILFGLLLLLSMMGLIILYSAANQSFTVLQAQVTKLLIAFSIMILFAQIPPFQYRRWTPILYGAGLTLLLIVLTIGHIGKGAQRWLDLGILRFQPSELLKLGLPMMLAWYLSEQRLPPTRRTLLIAALIIIPPVILTAKQPDLGTALLIASAGFFVVLLAGVSWRVIASMGLLGSIAAPLLWYNMRTYQHERVLTFLNPERDPLGSGYHIIQSKIAIGSGGFFGKGWLNGTQAHLAFLPEHATDFIFAVCGEEFGFLGGLLLIVCYLLITSRCLIISLQAQDTFTRLLAGALSLMFFISAFINIGMVSGILPVVGLPLPLVSYGGTSIVTLFAGFGVLMSIHTHRKLIPT